MSSPAVSPGPKQEENRDEREQCEERVGMEDEAMRRTAGRSAVAPATSAGAYVRFGQASRAKSAPTTRSAAVK